MDQHEMLCFAAKTLDRLQIPYFVTGSFAGVIYGEVRQTNDIDIVVELHTGHLDAFLVEFPQEKFYLEPESIRDAVRNRFQFNVIHRESLMKIDFIISPGSSHDREVFRRTRRSRAVIGYDVSYSSPEDLLLKKLTFYKMSDSEKHLRDCVGILKKSRDLLDFDYIEKWADWLDVYKGWKVVKQLAAGSDGGTTKK
jgi:hypothetical protein